MKFNTTETAPHQFDFCEGDVIVRYAQTNGMKVRGHTLVWHNALPPWLTSGNYTSAEAASLLQEHITVELSHYKGQVGEWDVVNEAIAYRRSIWPDAFVLAYKAGQQLY